MEEAKTLVDFDQNPESAIYRQQLIDSGANEVAILDFDVTISQQRDLLVHQLVAAEREHRDYLSACVTALMLAITAISVIESLSRHDAVRIRTSLATCRCALLAIWLAAMLATPMLLKPAITIFVIILITIALAIHLVPLHKPLR